MVNLTTLQRNQIDEWLHFGEAGQDERADDALVKLTSATGRAICTLNAAWLRSLVDAPPAQTEDTAIVDAIERRELTIEQMGTTVEYVNVYGLREAVTTAGGHNRGKRLRQLIREAMGWPEAPVPADVPPERARGCATKVPEAGR